jgi:hypothetical protein
MMSGVADVLAVLVWPACLAWIVWLQRAPLAALIEAVTSRLRREPPS